MLKVISVNPETHIPFLYRKKDRWYKQGFLQMVNYREFNKLTESVGLHCVSGQAN